jgi:hypothetical protein
MIFDVMVEEAVNSNGKQIIFVYRVHDSMLSRYLRELQIQGKYIIGVIPLFKNRFKKEDEKNEVVKTKPMTLEEMEKREFIEDKMYYGENYY